MKKIIMFIFITNLLLTGCATKESKENITVKMHTKSKIDVENHYKDVKKVVKIVNIKHQEIPKQKRIEVELIAQMPELPRGCEVTSLAMLLSYNGFKVDKMKLAKEIKKDITPYNKQNGVISFGNPDDGFVGDMYSFKNPGLGVYHKPINELLKKYMGNKVVDITGSQFDKIIEYLAKGHPVWVINNTWFDTVPEQYWQNWHTPTGDIHITYKEHSVLVTGYDEEYVYFNDPLAKQKNRKVFKDKFINGWKQMGSQAVSYE